LSARPDSPQSLFGRRHCVRCNELRRVSIGQQQQAYREVPPRGGEMNVVSVRPPSGRSGGGVADLSRVGATR
jgi:hypothetical protein